MDMGNDQRAVHFTPTYANRLMVGKLLERGLGEAVKFVPVKYEEVAANRNGITVLMWGEGTKHGCSQFLDRGDGAKASVDAHFDFHAVWEGRLVPVVEEAYKIITCANHMVFSRLAGKEIKLVIPLSEITGNLKTLERIARNVANGTGRRYDVEGVRKVTNEFSIIEIETAQDGALAGVKHLTVDCDAIGCFPSMTKWILDTERGFSLEQVVGVVRRLRQNGETIFDFGGLMKVIPEFEVVQLPPAYVPGFSETKTAVKIAQDSIGTEAHRAGQDIVNRVYTYALNCYEALIKAYFGLE